MRGAAPRWTFPAARGDAVVVAAVLAGAPGVRWPTSPTPPVTTAAGPDDEMVQAAAAFIATGCLQWLVTSGGARQRPVLRRRGGRVVRAHVRLWEPSPPAQPDEHDGRDAYDAHDDDDGRMSLRMGPRARALWWAIATELLPVMQRRSDAASTLTLPAHAKAALDALAVDEHAATQRCAPAPFVDRDDVQRAPGDLVFLALAHEHLHALRLSKAIDDELRTSLRAACPLAHLLGADDPRVETGGLSLLAAPVGLLVVESTLDAQRAGLQRALTSALVHAVDAGEMRARAAAWARTVTTWIDVLDEAQRTDLLEPVQLALSSLPALVPADWRARLVKLPGATSMAERQTVIDAVLAVCDVARRLDRVRASLRDVRYGDERFEEAALALPLLAAHDATLRPALDETRARVSGAVG